jgi:hypothetical protein
VKRSWTRDRVIGGHGRVWYHRDELGHLADLLRPDSTNVRLSYAASTGRLEEVAIPRGEIAFDYDGAGRLETLTSPDGVTLSYEYDGPIATADAVTPIS